MPDNFDSSKDFQKLYKLTDHKQQVTDMAWSPDRKWLASCSLDGVLHLWSLLNNNARLRFNFCSSLKSPITSLAWSQDSRYIACSSQAGIIDIWKDSGGIFQPARVGLSNITSTMGAIRCLAWSPLRMQSGQKLAFGGEDRVAHFYNCTNHDPTIREFGLGHVESILSIAWSPDGETVATGTQKGTIGIWKPFGVNAPNMKSIRAQLDEEGFGARFADSWSADNGMRGSFSSERHKLHLLRDVLSASSGILAHEGAVTSLTWSTENKILASCANDGFLRLWDEDGKLIDKFDCTEIILSVRFVYGGRLLIIQTIDQLFIFRSAPLQIICSYSLPAFFDPSLPFFTSSLAVDSGFRLGTIDPDDNRVINVWQVDYASLLAKASFTNRSYRAICVSLFGELEAGRSSLARALTGNLFNAKHVKDDSHIYSLTLPSVMEGSDGNEESREIFFWDLPSDSSHALMQRIHAGDGNVALIVLRRSHGTLATDNENIVKWKHALRHLRAASKGLGIATLLTVITHCDEPNGMSSDSDIQIIQNALEVERVFFVSAKTNQGIFQLRSAIEEAIDWHNTTLFSSVEIFKQLLETASNFRKKRRYIVSISELYDALLHSCPVIEESIPNHNDDQFIHGIRLMEAQGGVYFFDHSDEVLLEPEYYRTYAAAMILGAWDDESGMGRLPLKEARSGYGKQMQIAEEKRIGDQNQQARLLELTIKEFQEQKIAQEVCAHGVSYLVFQNTLPDVPVPRPACVVKYRFKGAIDEIFSSLIVKLLGLHVFYHKKELSHNEALFSPVAGGGCGFRIEPNAEGNEAELCIYFEEKTSRDDQKSFIGVLEKHIEDYNMEEIPVIQPYPNHSEKLEPINPKPDINEIEVFFLWQRDNPESLTMENIKHIADFIQNRGIRTNGVTPFPVWKMKSEINAQLDKSRVALVPLTGKMDKSQLVEFSRLKKAGCRFLPIILQNAPVKYTIPKELQDLGFIDLRGKASLPENLLVEGIREAWELGPIPPNQGHVFISCFMEDIELVNNLKSKLESADHKVWWEHGDALQAGMISSIKIKEAIKNSYAFIFCVSDAWINYPNSSVYSQINNAIEVQRNFHHSRTFIIPVKLSECELPNYEIYPTTYLSDLKPFNYLGQSQNVSKLVDVLNEVRTQSKMGTHGS